MDDVMKMALAPLGINNNHLHVHSVLLSEEASTSTTCTKVPDEQVVHPKLTIGCHPGQPPQICHMCISRETGRGNFEVLRRVKSIIKMAMKESKLRSCDVCECKHSDDEIGLEKQQEFGFVKNLEKLRNSLKMGYPSFLLLYFLFYAVEKGAWEPFRILLKEPSADVWIQCHDAFGQNIVQKILCSLHHSKVNIGPELLCTILSRLQECMDSSSLKVLVNEIWHSNIRPECLRFDSPFHTQGMFPLHMATALSLPNCVLELLRCGANVDLVDGQCETALMIAAKDHNIEIIELLVNHGARVTADSDCHESALSLFIQRFESKKKVSYNMKRGLTLLLEVTDYIDIADFKTVLGYLDASQVSILVQKGFPITDVDGDQEDSAGNMIPEASPAEMKLWAYAMTLNNGSKLAIDTLTRKLNHLDMDINQMITPPYCLCPYDPYGFCCCICNCTPLQIACKVGIPDTVECLLHHGADPDVCGEKGRFPIMHILEYRREGALSCVKSLLRYGCELNIACPVDIQGHHGSNWLFPIDFYLIFNQLYIVRMLHVAGAKHFCPELHISKPQFNPRVLNPKTLSRDGITTILCKVEDRNKILKDLVTVPSLYHLARIAIRHAMHRDISTKIQALALPKHILNFLNLEELEDIEHQYKTIELKIVSDLDTDSSDDELSSSEPDSWSDSDTSDDI